MNEPLQSPTPRGLVALAAVCSVFFVSVLVGCVAAAAPDTSANHQVARGTLLYDSRCAACHAATLKGGRGPALKGDNFWSKWHDKTARKLYSRVLTTMPPDAPGTLAEQDVIDIVAYVLSANGVALPETTSAGELDEVILTSESTVPR